MGNNTIPRANQIKIILSFVIVAIIITLIIIFRSDLFRFNNNITDSERFYKEYNKTPVSNVYKYVTTKEAIELFESKSAAVLFGFKDCKWCQSYVPVLDEVAKENGVDTVYYCNIFEDRKENTEDYQKLVKLLEKYLYDDEQGNKRIYVPDVYFIKDGKIVGHNNDTSTKQGTDTEEYYTLHKEELKTKLTDLFKKIGRSCNDTKGC